jgi:hypothetical protein
VQDVLTSYARRMQASAPADESNYNNYPKVLRNPKASSCMRLMSTIRRKVCTNRRIWTICHRFTSFHNHPILQTASNPFYGAEWLFFTVPALIRIQERLLFLPAYRSPHLTRINREILSVLSYMLQSFVPLQWLSHIIGIFVCLIGLRHIVTVVFQNLSIHAVAHSLVQRLRYVVAFPHKKIHEPSVIFVTGTFQSLRERASETQTAGMRSDSKRGYVGVEWEVVFTEFVVGW